jgi:hypothetical protein
MSVMCAVVFMLEATCQTSLFNIIATVMGKIDMTYAQNAKKNWRVG